MTNDNAPTEQIENSADTQEKVENPEAVLRKNRELLEINAKLNAKLAQIENFDFDRAKTAIQQLQTLEEEKLAKQGEYEKLLEQKAKAWEERIESERQARVQIESRLKQEKLANALMEKGVLPDRVGYLVKELAEDVDLVADDGGFQLRRRNGIGDADEFDKLVEEVKGRSPFFFGANIVSGTGSSVSKNGVGGATKAWSELTRAEKVQAIRDAGGDAEAAQKKFK